MVFWFLSGLLVRKLENKKQWRTLLQNNFSGIWSERADDWYLIPLYVLALFLGGILVMLIYYKYVWTKRHWNFLKITLKIIHRYFHIRRLGHYDTEADISSKLKVCQCNTDSKYTNLFQDTISFHQKKARGLDTETCDGDLDGKRHVPTNEHLKGIFNCRFSNPVK